MTIKSLPAPDPENDNAPPRGSRRRQAQGDRRAEAPLPDVDRLLQMLLQLNAAVLLGVISTEAANVIHRNLRAVATVAEITSRFRSARNQGPLRIRRGATS